jgi:hypothetical protein
MEEKQHVEERQISGEESLAIITKMIENSRRNFNDGGGAMFLIWGYLTIAVTIAVTLAYMLTGNGAVMWGWWVLPIAGGLLTYRHFAKHPKGVKTHLDQNVSYVWLVFTVACLACSLFTAVSSQFEQPPLINILFIIGLMLGMATALTGLMIRFTPVVVGGFAGMALAFAIPLLAPSVWQLLVFAGIFVVGQIIPGHLLNAACKREMQERR